MLKIACVLTSVLEGGTKKRVWTTSQISNPPPLLFLVRKRVLSPIFWFVTQKGPFRQVSNKPMLWPSWANPPSMFMAQHTMVAQVFPQCLFLSWFCLKCMTTLHGHRYQNRNMIDWKTISAKKQCLINLFVGVCFESVFVSVERFQFVCFVTPKCRNPCFRKWWGLDRYPSSNSWIYPKWMDLFSGMGAYLCFSARSLSLRVCVLVCMLVKK